MAIQLANVVTCGCGSVLWGKDEDELLREAERHVRGSHPELIGTLSPSSSRARHSQAKRPKNPR